MTNTEADWLFTSDISSGGWIIFDPAPGAVTNGACLDSLLFSIAEPAFGLESWEFAALPLQK